MQELYHAEGCARGCVRRMRVCAWWGAASGLCARACACWLAVIFFSIGILFWIIEGIRIKIIRIDKRLDAIFHLLASQNDKEEI